MLTLRMCCLSCWGEKGKYRDTGNKNERNKITKNWGKIKCPAETIQRNQVFDTRALFYRYSSSFLFVIVHNMCVCSFVDVLNITFFKISTPPSGSKSNCWYSLAPHQPSLWSKRSFGGNESVSRVKHCNAGITLSRSLRCQAPPVTR